MPNLTYSPYSQLTLLSQTLSEDMPNLPSAPDGGAAAAGGSARPAGADRGGDEMFSETLSNPGSEHVSTNEPAY